MRTQKTRLLRGIDNGDNEDVDGVGGGDDDDDCDDVSRGCSPCLLIGDTDFQLKS